jgi:hypothetical protein
MPDTVILVVEMIFASFLFLMDSPASATTLVLFGAFRGEPGVIELRNFLSNKDGNEATGSGGLGYSPKDGYYWLRLDASGKATLGGIQRTFQDAGVPIALVKTQ